MVDPAAIQSLSDKFARAFRPDRIILFGSYAYGAPTDDSDVDLLVILPFEGRPARKAAEILSAVSPPFPVDLLVRTEEQLQQRLAWNDFFLREVVEKGTVLFAAADR